MNGAGRGRSERGRRLFPGFEETLSDVGAIQRRASRSAVDVIVAAREVLTFPEPLEGCLRLIAECNHADLPVLGLSTLHGADSMFSAWRKQRLFKVLHWKRTIGRGGKP